MHRVTIGMQVDIKRSNGRVHGAVITGVDKATQNVRVEWFEGGETKGKELEFATLLHYNQTLAVDNAAPAKAAPPPAIPAPSPHAHHKTYDSSKANFSSSVTRRADAVMSAAGDRVRDRQSIYDALKSPVDEVQAALPPVKVGNSSRVLKPISRPEALPNFEPDVDVTQILPPTAPTPVTSASSATNALFPSSRIPPPVVAVNSTMKSNCVNEVERLAARREERRQQQHAAKRLQEEHKAIDPGNPNWVYLSKIREYRATIDFRPLRLSDPVVDNRISVCVRKRPLSKTEIGRREVEVVTIPNKDHLVVHQLQSKVDLTKYLENQIFRFDYTFDENSNNEMIYRFTAQPLVKVIFDKGFATCFAYGQTGSGKTHTMGGNYTGKKQDYTKGIYYMTANDVFKMQQSPAYSSMHLSVVCSFFEIYGGKVFDLLNKRACLRILEDGNKSVRVVGLMEADVSTPDEVMQLIKKGNDHRTAGSTSANANSSRSHAIFQITLKNKKDEVHGKFSLIDLAGNERGADTTSADRQTRLEGADINKSLLALKECIRAMSMNKHHVPFRMSKLTLVLRDSFVNENARTCMIAMVSPGNSAVENTLNTLRYADRVKELGSDDCAKPMGDNEFRYDEDDENMDYSVDLNASQEDREYIRAAAKVSASKEAMSDALLAIYDRYKDLQKVIKQVEQDGVIDVDLERLALDSISLGNDFANCGLDLKNKGQQLLNAIKNENELNRRK
uniref:Kinesin-like protein n=1 Tax=Panagrellus redivivus TaxID=6233 RepID=A0A7E4WBG2_PANRE